MVVSSLSPSSSLYEYFFPADAVSGPFKKYSTTNPPDKDSGLQRLTVPFLAILGTLMAVYSALLFVFDRYFASENDGIWGLKPAPEFCPRQEPGQPLCHRPDLLAFQITSGLAFLVMGGYGFYCWHVKGFHKTSTPATPAGRCFSYIPQAEFVALVCLAFQVWDWIVSWTIPEHRTLVMMMHHTLAAAVSFSGLYAQYLIWYSFFFFGLSEVSSIFLVFLDLAKFFPPAEDSAFAAFLSMYCGPMFALTFLFYRGIMWWYITYLKFTDCYSIVKSGQAEKLRPGKTWVLFILLGFNLPMGCLQLYWSSLILAEVKKVLFAEGEEA